MTFRNIIESRLEKMYLVNSPVSSYKAIKVISVNMDKDFAVIECLCRKFDDFNNSLTVEFALANRDGDILMPFDKNVYYIENLNHNKVAIYKKNNNGDMTKEILSFSDLYNFQEFSK